ncbi:MAG: M23 family metallopeptidase [Treponema sp.]|nr:M23 family metallopeptidase [Treponema sp.]
MILFLLVPLFSCLNNEPIQTQVSSVQVHASPENDAIDIPDNYGFSHMQYIPGPLFTLSSNNALPGEPVTVGMIISEGGQTIRAALFDSRDRRIARTTFFPLEDPGTGLLLKAAVLAVPSTALIGNATIKIENDDVVIGELPFSIGHREFYSETIALNQANTDLRTLPDPERTAQSNQLWVIINTIGTEIYTTGPFIRPVTSTRRTSIYGARRIFQYTGGGTDTSIHAGVDYGVPTGTEVMASGRGRVVLARYRILTGNSVILEHMPGVFTIYYHLDSLAVNEGQIVEAGQLLGLSGATGLATGPHLHWEVRVAGENADPDAFLENPIIDKSDILNKLISTTTD